MKGYRVCVVTDERMSLVVLPCTAGLVNVEELQTWKVLEERTRMFQTNPITDILYRTHTYIYTHTHLSVCLYLLCTQLFINALDIYGG